MDGYWPPLQKDFFQRQKIIIGSYQSLPDNNTIEKYDPYGTNAK